MNSSAGFGDDKFSDSIAKPFFQAAAELEAQSIPFVVVTMLSSRGHAPQDPGAKIIVTENGLHCGTVGGGKIEARCIQEGLSILKTDVRVQVFHWNLQKDIGMSCGGEVSFLFESHQHLLWRVCIFGAGHVAQALVRTLLNLQVRIVCVDHRKEWLERLPENPKLKKIWVQEGSQSVSSVVDELSEDDYFVSMTQGHATDLPVLTEIFMQYPQSSYIGVLGSDIKAKKIRVDLQNALSERGLSEEEIKNRLGQLHCPIGLEFGNNSPQEISISIVAELLQCRDQKNGLK